MADEIINMYGRRPGRGVRPWLLVPKILGIAVYFGAVMTALGMWVRPGSLAMGRADLGALTRVAALARVEEVSFIMRFVAVPGLLVAIGCGIGLWLQHPGIFSRQRWWQYKLLALLVSVPGGHFFVSWRIAGLRATASDAGLDPALRAQVTWALTTVAVITAGVIVLGRVKPRLGQNRAALAAAGRAPHPPVGRAESTS